VEQAQGRAGAALAERFETVVRADARLLDALLPGSGERADAQRTLALPFAEFVLELEALDAAAVKRTIDNVRVLYVGSKDFEPPSHDFPALGMVQFTFCYVAIPGRGQSLDVEGGEHVERLPSGEGVWRWVSRRQGHTKRLDVYRVRLRGGALVLGNEIREVREVAHRLTVGDALGSERAQPALDGVLSGLRTYRSHDVGGGAEGAASSQAEAVKVIVDAGAKAVSVRLSNARGVSRIAELNGMLRAAQLREVAPGEWEASMPLAGPASTVNALTVLAILGYDLAI
jgi:hypothetical protein